MRVFLKIILAVLLAALLACSGGGSGGDGGSGSSGEFTTGRDTPERIAIDDYLNKIVIPILVRLDNAAIDLRRQIAVLLANPSSANFDATKAAWEAARIPWERNRSTNFGPLVSGDFEDRLSSWPIDTADLSALLAGPTELTESAVTALPGDLKGFHVIEYLIWGENGIKRPTEITQREAEMLTSLSEVLRSDTRALLSAWNRGSDPFAAEVASAGQGSEVFPTEDSMLEAAVRGMIAILTDVAERQLAEEDYQDVESRYSGNSLTEYVDDVVGARDIYTIAISPLVDDEAADLDIKGEFELAINSLTLIPEPFDAAIGSSSNAQRITNARNRIRDVINSLNNAILPLFIEQMQPVVSENGSEPPAVEGPAPQGSGSSQ